MCTRRKILCIPGCSTPSEISAAEEAGSDIIKVFPANILTPAFIKAFLAPSPWSRLLPSGGIKATREDIQGWIKAGAAAINLDSDLISHELVKTGDFEGLARKTEECIQWVREAMGDPVFQGVEHVGLYPTDGVKADNIAAWYAETFGFNKVERARPKAKHTQNQPKPVQKHRIFCQSCALNHPCWS